jgi:AcrR family transcriptional regulator
MGAEMKPQGRRESGKETRRRALLDSARRMLDDSELSMRRLAEAAGVSQATPYNLFGSKRLLFEALYDDQREHFLQRLDARAQPDPLLRLFDAIDLLADEFEAVPRYYRALFGVIYGTAPREEIERACVDPGIAFWTGLLGAAQAGGRISDGIALTPFVRNFVYLLVGAIMDWVEERIDAARWRAAMHYGLALAALPVAAPDLVADLWARIRASEAILREG